MYPHVPNLIITGVIDQRMTRRSGQARFLGSNYNFLEGRNLENTSPIFLKIGTVASVMDVN